jgi:hypothetical protein
MRLTEQIPLPGCKQAEIVSCRCRSDKQMINKNKLIKIDMARLNC